MAAHAMRRNLPAICLSALLVFFLGNAQAFDSLSGNSASHVEKGHVSDEAAQTRKAPVRSKALLDAYLKQSFNTEPLAYLSESARRRFVASLTFNDNGLTGFRYDDLEAELTFSQAYEILQLFGAQSKLAVLDLAVSSEGDAALFDVLEKSPPSLAQDYKEYKCIGRATCRLAEFHICMSGCTSIP